MRTLPVVLALSLAGCAPSERTFPPNVVLITIESLRPDHVSFQGGSNLTTPALETLAEEGIVYEDAHAVTSWTLTSHASLFTGLYPRAHGTVSPTDKLPDSYRTLAEVLRDAGYQTAGVASGPYLRRAHNLHQGFDHYDDSLAAPSHPEAHDDRTNPGMLARMLSFLDEERNPARPFLLFGYFWDPHYDYLPPPPWDRRFVTSECVPVDLRDYETADRVRRDSPPGHLAYAISQYEGEIGWTDDTLGKLFDALRERGLWENTVVVVTSDHGEEFFEHGAKGHKNNLHVESVHVPLIVKYPGRGSRGRDRRLVSLIDVVPTLLELTGTTTDAPLHGRSLLAPEPLPGRSIFFELLEVWFRGPPGGPMKPEQRHWFAVRTDRHKLIEMLPARQLMVYDVVLDPREEADLMLEADRPPEVHALRQELQRWAQEMDLCRMLFESTEAGGEAELSPEELQQLRDLGYL